MVSEAERAGYSRTMRARMWKKYNTTRNIELLRRDYWALCEYVDAQVGRAVNVLERRGQLDGTLLLFTSDHGTSLGDHWFGQKYNF